MTMISTVIRGILIRLRRGTMKKGVLSLDFFNLDDIPHRGCHPVLVLIF